MLRDQTWLLGPSAADDAGVIPGMLHRIGVPEERQQIFQSHAAALEEAKRGGGVTLAVAFAVAQDLAAGALVRVPGRPLQGQGSWNISILGRPAGHPRRRGDGPLRHHPARHPGDAARPRRHARPVQARRARDALELSPAPSARRPLKRLLIRCCRAL